MATYLSSDMYLPALPTVMKSFGVSHAEAQSTLTVWFLGSISVQLILGPIADRFGRKPVLCFGAVLFVLSSIACALATNFNAFLLARFFQGSSICFMAVPGYAAIHESFNQKEAIKILAIMGSVAVLAPAFGPVIGSVILVLLDWHWIFWFLVLWSTISAVSLIIWMPETLPPKKRQLLTMTPVLKNYLRIISNKQFIGTLTVYGLLFCAFITWIAAGPFLVIADFNSTPFMFALYQGLIFFSIISANYFVKKLIDHTGAKKMILFSLFFSLMTCTVSVITSYAYPHVMLGIIITYIIFAFTSGFSAAPLTRLTIEASNEPMGARMAIFSMFVSGFATLATILVSLFYNGTILSLSMMLFVMVLLATIIWMHQYFNDISVK